MSHSFKLSRRIARFRVALFASLYLTAAACDNSDSLNPEASTPQGVDPATETDPLSSVEEDAPVQDEDPGVMTIQMSEPTLASVSFAGGIAMGTYHQPTATLGSRYNGGLRNIWPSYLVNELAAIKSRGGKVVLSLAGAEHNFKDAAGNFSLTKWKQRVDRFRGVNFSSYLSDGTVIAHYVIDEPNDPSNWNGKPVPASTVEEMARYSKSIWPGMATVVRVDPSYLRYDHRYLDAAWAQYVYRKGAASDYIKRNVSAAQDRGLALVTGLNISKGGPNGARMTASQVRDWGSTLLGSSYPCAFVSWQWNTDYMSTSGMKDAMDVLRNKAQNRSLKSCKS